MTNLVVDLERTSSCADGTDNLVADFDRVSATHRRNARHCKKDRNAVVDLIRPPLRRLPRDRSRASFGDSDSDRRHFGITLAQEGDEVSAIVNDADDEIIDIVLSGSFQRRIGNRAGDFGRGRMTGQIGFRNCNVTAIRWRRFLSPFDVRLQPDEIRGRGPDPDAVADQPYAERGLIADPAPMAAEGDRRQLVPFGFTTIPCSADGDAWKRSTAMIVCGKDTPALGPVATPTNVVRLVVRPPSKPRWSLP